MNAGRATLVDAQWPNEECRRLWCEDEAPSAEQTEKENSRNRTSCLLITNLSHSPLLRQKDVHAALPIHFLHVANKAGRSYLVEQTRSPQCGIHMEAEMPWEQISHGVTRWGTMSRYPGMDSASKGTQGWSAITTYRGHCVASKKVSLAICVSKTFRREPGCRPSGFSDASSTPSNASSQLGSVGEGLTKLKQTAATSHRTLKCAS